MIRPIVRGKLSGGENVLLETGGEIIQGGSVRKGKCPRVKLSRGDYPFPYLTNCL